MSISQLYDKGFKILFESSMYIVTISFDVSIKFVGYRLGNIYVIDLNDLAMCSGTSLVAMDARI